MIKQEDKKYIANTYARYDLLIETGKGATAVDENGREYIDFGSGIGVTSLGYCNDGWVNAVSNQATKLQHTSNLYYTEPCVKLAKKLCEYAGFDKVFFGNSGAEANECAIKVARKYSFDKYGDGRNKIISLKNSFHGRTITTLSATGQEHYHDYFFPFTDGFEYVEANEICGLEDKISSDTCGIMLEVVQGEGGVISIDRDFAKEIRKICDDNDIVMIIDEVQTGIGRTGKFLASENIGIKADVVTLAKGLGGGLPIGAALLGEKVSKVLAFGDHGSTFGGNPVVCAGANYVMDIISNQEFLLEVCKKSEYMRDKIAAFGGVESISGVGLMMGIELSKRQACEVAKECLANGLLILTAKTKLRLLPPLTISMSEIDKGLSILKNVLEEDEK